MADLAILVPVYQREEGALRAVGSVVNQARQELDRGVLSIHVRDDASPDIDAERLTTALRAIHPAIRVDVNPANLGMSANIRSMVSGCRAEFCSILTDDDWFEPGSIADLLAVIQNLKESPGERTSCFFCPRYSYTEAGEHVCTSCRVATSDTVFASHPVSTMKLADQGYILTGLFFRPDLIDHTFWEKHESNAFFPVLYFATLLSRGSCLYLERPWVRHTVANLCHWQAWGSTKRAQQQRLCRDFLTAISLVHGYLTPRCRSLKERLLLWPPAIKAYRRRLIEMRTWVWQSPGKCIPVLLWLNPLFLFAFVGFLYFSLRSGSYRTVGSLSST